MTGAVASAPGALAAAGVGVVNEQSVVVEPAALRGRQHPRVHQDGVQQVCLAEDQLLVRLVTCGRHAERERQEQPHQPQEGTLELAEIRAVVFPELRASPPTEAEADVRYQHQHAEQADDDDATWDFVQRTHVHGFSGSGPRRAPSRQTNASETLFRAA